LSAASGLRYLYLAYFSQPAGDRLVYRLIRRHRPRRIVELGLGMAERSRRTIRLAARYHDEPIDYTGIDRFESRSREDHPGLSLKAAHTALVATEAKVRLVPGDPLSALSRVANGLANTDLLLISSLAGRTCPAAWFFVPRMLHEHSLVLIEETLPGATEPAWRRLPHDELAALAGSRSERRAA